MRNYTLLVLALGMLAGCTSQSSVKVERHVIVEIFKKKPISVHDEISPRYYAVLENGDTVPVHERTRINDTVTYKYYQYVEK
jgi:uncharacterized protein YcfL